LAIFIRIGHAFVLIFLHFHDTFPKPERYIPATKGPKMEAAQARWLSVTVRTFAVGLLLVAPLVMSAPVSGDPDSTGSGSTVSRLFMKDGTVLVGSIVRKTVDSLEFRTGSGVLVMLPQSQVGEIEEVTGTFVNGEYRRYDPNTSRLFFGPTAEPVRGGYFSTYEIFFPFVAFGLGDIFTLAGGMSLFPGAPEQLYYVAPKITIPLGMENFGVAGGLVYTNVFGDEGEGGAGFAYGVTTIGSKGTALTLGLGYGFAGGEWANNPVILAGGETRLSNSVALITENWFAIGSDVSVLSFGVRFFGDHLSSDLGFIYPLSVETDGGFPLLPWLGFSYKFGH
jgi:hypothetical protein